ncbi:MAG: hypothetical protein R8K54_06905 [Mariprofundaceae bacterium]
MIITSGLRHPWLRPWVATQKRGSAALTGTLRSPATLPVWGEYL